MRKGLLTFTILAVVPFSASALQEYYCPQNQAYVNLGMTKDQVETACGAPLSTKTVNTAATQKVPVQQFIYTDLNTGSVYPGLNNIYYLWALPSGSTGVSLQVDVMNNKVSSIALNGNSTNAMSICGGGTISVGDSVGQIYRACGTPGMVNNTYVEQPLPGKQKPVIWIYRFNQYQPPVSLTFINDKLQSID